MSANTQIENSIELPDAPAIPGIRFRRYRGEVDLPAMLEVVIAGTEMDGTERSDTLEDMTKNYSNLKNCDPYRDMLLVEVNGELVGYNRVLWEVELDGTRIYLHFGFLKPEWRGKGIGTALLRWAESHLREIAADHPETGPRVLDSWTLEQQTHLVGLLEKEGYEPVRYGYYMLRPDLENIPDLPMPEGLEVRPVEKEHLRTIWDAEIEAFRDHWGATDPQDGDFDRWLLESSFQPDLWQVAWDGDQVAGMVRTFINKEENERYGRKRGYTEYISTRRPWRKRGLARALMARSMQLQKELGMIETALGVDAQNPSGALQIYESMGFRAYKKEMQYRKTL
ncbi:MAG: GNAT family N-acetyltransferase [Chloroflexota bacterium]